jgi:hypothetical protein
MFVSVLPLWASRISDLVDVRFLRTFSLAPRAETRAEKTVLWTLFAISGLTLLGIVIFYIMNPRQVIGDQLVNTPSGSPEEIPSPSVSPIYLKPVTLLFIAGVIFSYCFFALIQDLISKSFPKAIRHLLLVVSLLLLAIGVYEVSFNFALWGAQMSSGAAPNIIVNSFPISSVKVNLDYATKATLLWCVAALFSVLAFKNSLEIKDKNSELVLVQ